MGAVPVLREFFNDTATTEIYTMRSGKLEKEAVAWFKENGIPLYAVNSNPTQKKWTKSPKVHADVYIDDGALGVPLIHSMTTSRPYVDWVKVREWLVEEGFL